MYRILYRGGVIKAVLRKEKKSMNESTKTKKALRGSLLALFLCIVLLIGTTFAWFTDTASTGVNKIQAGNLDIELQMKANNGKWVNAEGKTLPFLVEGKIPAENTQILWEPGCTYYVPEVRVLNKGNLAVKFEYVTEPLGVTGNLAEVLEPVFKTPTDTNGKEIDIESEILKPGETSPAWSFGYHMSETAGNEYQNETATGMYMTVVATQATYEKDSIDDQYDKDATYPKYTVTDAKSLTAAAKEGGIITVSNDIESNKTIVANGTVQLDMNGKTLANSDTIWKDKEDPNNWSLVSAQNGSNLTIDGNGTFRAKENDCFAVDVQDGSNVVIKNGTFVGNVHAVYVLEGTATIEGGTFSVQQKYDAQYPDEYVLNCYDTNYKKGNAKIIVKGGTFINFNPADCRAEGAHTNFVAAGYKVVSEPHGSDTWYKVVKE